MSSPACFIFTAHIVPQNANGLGRPAHNMTISHLANSKFLHHDCHLRAVGDNVQITMKRPTLGLGNLFARPATRTNSDGSTPSISGSQSRSTSPTSSFLIDDDPFAKIDSPISPSLEFGLDPPSPTLSAELVRADASPRSPLAPRQAVGQRHSHEHSHAPVSLRLKPHKLVRNTPSLPSLSDLARASGSSYASAVGRTDVSKRFPVEPWDLPEIPRVASTEPDEDYGFQLPSSLATRPSVITPADVFTRQSSSIPAPECDMSYGATLGWAESHPGDVGQCELLDEPSWWDVVHDSKDAMESEDDTEEDDDPEDAGVSPPIHEATWQQAQGHQGGMPRGGEGEGDTSSDYGSDDYGSDGASGGYGGGGSGGRRGRDDDENRRGRSAFSDDPETEESENENDSEDSEDNVPLAQRIPGAIQAQKSIRIKDKADRERRRRERQAQKHPKSASVPKPQPAPAPLVDDLTKRLLQVQASDSAATGSQSSQRRAVQPQQQQQQQAVLRSARSLHRPSTSATQAPPRHVSLEETRTRHTQQESSSTRYTQESNSAPLSRHPTTASRSRKPSLSQPMSQGLPTQAHPTSQPLSRSGTSAHHHRQPQPQVSTPPPRFASELLSPQLDFDAGPRRSHDVVEQREGPTVRARALSSAAAPAHRVLHRARTSGSVPPTAPPMPPMPQEAMRQLRDPSATQHRVFVGDMQRFNTVEIGPQTRARDVLDLVKAQGELRGEAAAMPGGWMMWELAQDFGMERPLREYELPAEIYASWNSNTRLNAFMIKKTPLAAALARNAMPSSSPRFSGYVQWESKRGKWNKRWMELKEHSIWLSKRDTGKDQTFLCSLSNFDCYYVSRLHKAPKSFVFAVKSTDNLTLFENPADYLHVFSCDSRDGQKWMEHILLARSYVLHKERTVLFSTPATTSSSAIPPTPSNTHKIPALLRPAAPLVNVNTLQSPPTQSAAPKNPFQSGSLLAKTSV